MNDYEHIINIMTEIVDAYGRDFKYSKHFDVPNVPFSRTCFYVWNDEPDCLIGKVLFQSGYATIDELKAIEGSSPLMAETIPFSGLSSIARSCLNAAQKAQDNGQSWGIALDRARQVVENLKKP